MMKQRVMKRAKKKRTEIKAGNTLAPLGTVKKSNYYIIDIDIDIDRERERERCDSLIKQVL